MKSQDIGLLLKLVSLEEQETQSSNDREISYTARALEQETGISKSQVNLSINRCYDIGLLKKDRRSGVPRVNVRALEEFICYGLKYVFPAKAGVLTRGIPTAFAAPILSDKLMSAGDLPLVWPDAKGSTKGLSIEPLFKSATTAIQNDPKLYALLALVDAIRVGHPREANLAKQLLKEQLGVSPA
ncbi:hypothetical protein [Leucothrix pacifica]|uniref:Uncharacterized protein n=1 Tax=Leucothrix pacifica TaxID=1247513 RepID=A0A317CBC4_9GAMM|nr:hypothetical protein [Leucothrix pacifica]PWQ95657.1 hypothetical protein DKW60_14675 [Leucothrix pacifica]